MPSFDKIITSRNVRFNEACFYKGSEQEVKETSKLIDEYELLINIIHEPNLEAVSTGVAEKLGLLQDRPVLTPDSGVPIPDLEVNNIRQQSERGAEDANERPDEGIEAHAEQEPAQIATGGPLPGKAASQPEPPGEHVEADEPRDCILVAPEYPTALADRHGTPKAGDNMYSLGVRTPSNTRSPPFASTNPSEGLDAPRPVGRTEQAEPGLGTVETAARYLSPDQSEAGGAGAPEPQPPDDLPARTAPFTRALEPPKVGSTRASEFRRTLRVTRPTTRVLEADVRPRRQRGGGSAQRGRRRGDDNSTSFAYTIFPVGRDRVSGDNNVLAN
ncbi:hypothetical protein MCOR23_007547 [Pyricularia oryzae]|nr:hypothetical protein MCOR23_007547 [Pyricularia oryzae]